MMFLLNLHRNLPSDERFEEALDALHALDIPDAEIDKVSSLFEYALELPVTCYGHSREWVENMLFDIGIEVHWV